MTSQLRDIPAIFVALYQVEEQELLPLFWGMEEEGIPYRIVAHHTADSTTEAFQAASLSPLAVGIACSARHVVLHTRNLPPDTPLYQLKRQGLQQSTPLRHLGCNAARLVKGLPFKPWS